MFSVQFEWINSANYHKKMCLKTFCSYWNQHVHNSSLLRPNEAILAKLKSNINMRNVKKNALQFTLVKTIPIAIAWLFTTTVMMTNLIWPTAGIIGNNKAIMIVLHEILIIKAWINQVVPSTQKTKLLYMHTFANSVNPEELTHYQVPHLLWIHTVHCTLCNICEISVSFWNTGTIQSRRKPVWIFGGERNCQIFQLNCLQL